MASNSSQCVHGWPDGGGCLCSPEYTGQDCSTPVDWSSAQLLYQIFLQWRRVVFSLVCALALWRTLIIVLSRRAGKRCSIDSQLALLLCIDVGMALQTILSVDPLAKEGIFTLKTTRALLEAASAFDLAAASIFVRIFVSIFSRFHRPTRLVRPALDCFTAAMTLGVLACVPPALSPLVHSATVETAYNVLVAIWVVVLIIGSSVYSISVLKLAAKTLSAVAGNAANSGGGSVLSNSSGAQTSVHARHKSKSKTAASSDVTSRDTPPVVVTIFRDVQIPANSSVVAAVSALSPSSSISPLSSLTTDTFERRVAAQRLIRAVRGVQVVGISNIALVIAAFALGGSTRMSKPAVVGFQLAYRFIEIVTVSVMLVMMGRRAAPIAVSPRTAAVGNYTPQQRTLPRGASGAHTSAANTPNHAAAVAATAASAAAATKETLGGASASSPFPAPPAFGFDSPAAHPLAAPRHDELTAGAGASLELSRVMVSGVRSEQFADREEQPGGIASVVTRLG